jgi:hypothetical protein
MKKRRQENVFLLTIGIGGVEEVLHEHGQREQALGAEGHRAGDLAHAVEHRLRRTYHFNTSVHVSTRHGSSNFFTAMGGG